MKTRFRFSLMGLAFLLLSSLPLNAAPMTNADVIKMVQAGIDESVIITAIQKAQSGFDVSPDGLIALNQAKVSKEIINAMVTRSSERDARGRPVAKPTPAAKDTQPPIRFYVSASVVHATYSESGVSSGTGVGAAFGIGIKQRHFIETELMYWKHSRRDHNWSSISTSRPVLATYRFGIPFGSSRWGMQFGGSFGVWKRTFDNSYPDYHGGAFRTPHGDTVMLGLQTLCIFRVSDRFSAHTGIKLLGAAGNYSTEDVTLSIFTLGANFHF